MSKQYIVHWSPVALEPLEVLERVEPILTANDFTVSGTARCLVREGDALYYEISTLDEKGASATDLIQSAFGEGWSGVALRLIYRGYDVLLSFFPEDGRTSMILDEESPLFYDQNENAESANAWLSLLLELTASIAAPVCLFEKEPTKRILDSNAFVDSLGGEGLVAFANPIVAIVHESLLSTEQAMQMQFDDIKIRIGTEGYSVFTWMGPVARQ